MNIVVQRALRTSVWGAPSYILYVTLVCTDEETATIDQHRLAALPLFAVPEIETHQQSAHNAFARGDGRSVFQASDARKLLGDNLAGLFHVVRAKMAYVLTVADAIGGTTIYCPDLFEMLAAEQQIAAAFDDLNRHVGDAFAFTVEREQVLAPDGDDEPDGLPPADWADQHRWWRPR